MVVTVLTVLPWRWLDPPTSAFMLRAGAQGIEVEHLWVDWRDMAEHLPIAIVAAEDQRFPFHHGFDVASIRTALDERRDRMRGASTLSQQVAKNLFLWSGRSWVRKGLEAWFTLAIEGLWPKRRILEVYLNICQLGPRTYGVGAAAERFFGGAAHEISAEQAALLAAVLPNPERMSVAKPSAYVRERAAWIERQVAQLGGASYLADL